LIIFLCNGKIQIYKTVQNIGKTLDVVHDILLCLANLSKGDYLVE